MTSIGFFSTDFVSEPIVDERKSALTGRQEFVRGQQRLIFGGTYYARGAMPAMELNKHGYDNHLSWRFDIASDGHLRTLDVQGEWHDPEVFWSQRWMARDAADQMRRARSTGQICIADLDDDFWSLTKTNIAYDTTDPKNNPDFNRDHYWNMLGACDAITVSTEALRKRVEKLGVPTYVVRNAVDINQWKMHDPGSDGMIGWVGGIQWRAHDLQMLRPIMSTFLQDYGLPIYHGGDSQVEGVPKFYEQMGINPHVTRCWVAPLTTIQQYPSLWEPINLALVPLQDCAFNKAKSFLKSLEASACGLPYIVSDRMPEQRILIDEGGAGRVARNDKPQTWRNHLEDLLDPEVRRAEGKINRSVAELHDIGTRWSDWDTVFSQYAKIDEAVAA